MRNIGLVVPLKAICNRHAAIVGGKALGLAGLIRAGLPVPAGFCMTTTAYTRHLDSAELRGHLESALCDLSRLEPNDKSDTLRDIRKRIVESPLSETFVAEIEKAYNSLGATNVAVRSSATAEDTSQYSAAGQYDTYLGIASLEGCFEAIKKCWASLWTDRAYEYRTRNNIDHHVVEMAVIVQSLVPADTSGVLFTVDPSTGRPDRVVIESCFGLGEALVCGKVTPDSIHIGKKSKLLLAHTVSAKNVETILDKNGSILHRPVSIDRASIPSIDEATARRLTDLAVKYEKYVGVPQDIEWAVYNAKIFILQARPITAIKERSWEDRQVWTNSNFGEVAPDTLTPITWSFIEMFAKSLFSSVTRMVCIKAGPENFAGLVAGRIYWNINTCIAALRHLPGSKRIDWPTAFGGGDDKQWLSLLDIPDEDIPNIHGSIVKAILRTPLSLYELYTHRPKKAWHIIRHIAEAAENLQKLDMESLSDEQIADQLYDALDQLHKSLDILYVVLGLSALPVFAFCARRWLNDKDNSITAKLLAGIQGMESAQAGLDLWKLAAKANNLNIVREAIISSENWCEFHRRIKQTQQGDEFSIAYEQFMYIHGHHCRGELEFVNPRWWETPDYILGQLRAYLKSMDNTNPIEHYQNLIEQRTQLQAECEHRLKNPIKRYIFRRLLHKSQAGCVIRENSKDAAVRLVNAIRGILIELGNRFYNKDILQSRDDIFFLLMSELGPIAAGDIPKELNKTIHSRRTEYEVNKTLTPPSIIVGKFDKTVQVVEDFDPSVTSLTGIGASPGTVTGKARVILRADENQQIHGGEILVAPFTDPGWTPYFIPAVAIVTDQGGQLSHGSVIAREYGIPAVVNVSHATKIIKTGQTIRVDGDHGTVTILDSSH